MAPDLTKEFVSKLVGQPIKSFEVGAGAKPGDNVAGSLESIKVTTEKDEVIALVHKTFPFDPTGRSAQSGTFRVENTFYSSLAPMLEKLLKSQNVPDSSLPIPKFYAGFNDDVDDYITMEDLRPKSYVMPDKYKGLNLAEVTLVLKHLAQFHASTYFLLRHEGEKVLDEFPLIKKTRWSEPPQLLELGLMITAVNKFCIELIKNRDTTLGKKMEECYSKKSPGSLFTRTMLSTDTLFFPCVVHGDIWCNNMLFLYGGPENDQVLDVKFIDFQQVRRGNIFEDILYFFFTSTNSEFRALHLYNSLAVYYKAFATRLAELKCPMPMDFTLGFLVQNFEDLVLSSYTHMQFALPLQFGVMPDMKDMPFMKPEESGEKKGPEEKGPELSPAEMQLLGFIGVMKGMMENCPRAVERLEELTREMVERRLL